MFINICLVDLGVVMEMGGFAYDVEAGDICH